MLLFIFFSSPSCLLLSYPFLLLSVKTSLLFLPGKTWDFLNLVTPPSIWLLFIFLFTSSLIAPCHPFPSCSPSKIRSLPSCQNLRLLSWLFHFSLSISFPFVFFTFYLSSSYLLPFHPFLLLSLQELITLLLCETWDFLGFYNPSFMCLFSPCFFYLLPSLLYCHPSILLSYQYSFTLPAKTWNSWATSLLPLAVSCPPFLYVLPSVSFILILPSFSPSKNSLLYLSSKTWNFYASSLSLYLSPLLFFLFTFFLSLFPHAFLLIFFYFIFYATFLPKPEAFWASSLLLFICLFLSFPFFIQVFLFSFSFIFHSSCFPFKNSSPPLMPKLETSWASSLLPISVSSPPCPYVLPSLLIFQTRDVLSCFTPLCVFFPFFLPLCPVTHLSCRASTMPQSQWLKSLSRLSRYLPWLLPFLFRTLLSCPPSFRAYALKNTGWVSVALLFPLSLSSSPPPLYVFFIPFP